MSTALQYLIVALIVLPCAFYAAGVFAPQLKRRALRGAALWLLRPERAPALRRLGLRLLPPEQAAGCGAGCSDCNNCAPPPSAEQPLLDLRRR
ncbi:MAG TPA: DUF6587 family protein [Nevskia sp.]|jgi:hypothetical protein|nr:DUF6587 family protein [Nevskia sp.]